jgi:hypothetical protein
MFGILAARVRRTRPKRLTREDESHEVLVRMLRCVRDVGGTVRPGDVKSVRFRPRRKGKLVAVSGNAEVGEVLRQRVSG